MGPITIPNRIVRTAHGTMLTGERLIAYHEARAAGGVGMSTLEATGVHANAPSVTPLYSDDVIPIYRELMARIRPHGMKMFQQIYHPGSATRPKKAATQVSSSAIPNPMVGGIPMEMDHSMIAEMVDAFAAATRRCRDGGLDGVDLHASSGYLIEQFLSPANNVRTDEYGGSLENRMRFLMEILQAIRAEVGDDYCVGIRLPNEEYIPGGLTPQDVAEIAQLVEPYVDYVSLHMGSYWRFHKLLSPMDDPLGSEMPVNEVITRVVDKPTIVVGRIMTLDHAEHIVASGGADMVSMVRALIADPALVNKARDGEEHLIRPCIGSNFGCVGNLMSTGTLSCVVNVAAAEETTVSFEPSPGRGAQAGARRRRRAWRAGGRPHGGAARPRGAPLRGDPSPRGPGGDRRDAPHRSDVGAITEWLTSEIERLGVTIRLASMVEPDLVAELAPDEVIIATGQLTSSRRIPAGDAGRSRPWLRPAPRVHVVGRVRLRWPGAARGSGRGLRRHRHVRGDLGRRCPARRWAEGDHGRPQPGDRGEPALSAGDRRRGARAVDVGRLRLHRRALPAGHHAR